MKRFIRKDLPLLMKLPNGRNLSTPNSRCSTAQEFAGSREFHQSSTKRVVKPYLLADIGEGITECQIINWFVKPGDHVEQFDRICEVQSDKASVEITSRWDGTIKNLRHEIDDMARVGQPLLDIDIKEIEQEESPKESEENEATVEEVDANYLQEQAGSKSYTPQIVQTTPMDAKHALQPFIPQAKDTGPSLLIPSVRHMLKELNIDISEVHGTGRNGRISKEDVQRYQSEKTSLSSPNSSSLSRGNATPSPASAHSSITAAEDRLIASTPTMNIMFKTMTHSLTIPHFLYTHSIDVTSTNTLRKRFNSSSANRSGPKLTLFPFILKALSHAFTQMPKLNAHLENVTDTSRGIPQLLLKGQHNFGIAVDTSHGLLVPVIRNVQAHSVTSLAGEVRRLSALAKDGKLGVDDFKGATFTVSNIGSIGGGAVSPIIVAPQVGIVGIGGIQAVPRFEQNEKTGEEVLIRKEEVVLSWSADHRVLDGATVARCAEVVGRLVGDWGTVGMMLK